MDTKTGQIIKNVDTGAVQELLEKNKASEQDEKSYIRIKEDDMTDKQRATLQVSKYDSISKLGKLFTGCRKERRRKAKQYRSNLKRMKG